MSAQTMAYPRAQSRQRTTARASAKAPRRSAAASRTSRDQARSSRAEKDGRNAGSARKERASRGPRLTRADVADFASRHRLPLAVVLVALVLVAALYGPTCDLYRAWRTTSTREAELSQIEDSNDAYQAEIDRLQTREGIEDEARRRGYVADGETSVVVEGLEETSDDADATTDDTPWYLRLGDTIFGYEAE